MAVKHSTLADGTFSASGATAWDANHTIEAGTITEAMQVLADNTTGDVSTTKHGYVPKAPNDTTKFLRGDATWAVPSASATLDGISAATADQAGISNGDWNIRWNWQKTTDSEVAFTFGESAASTNGTSTSGVPNQNIVRISTLAASTASPLSVYSRGSHVFSVSPTAAQLLATNGSSSNAAYGFASSVNSGLYLDGSNGPAIARSGTRHTLFYANQLLLAAGSLNFGAPQIGTSSGSSDTGLTFDSTSIVGIACGGREMVRWTKASAGGGWQIMDEADSNPTTTELDATDSFAMYMKADKLVFAYNVAGTMNYLTIPLDGATTTWTNSTTAP